MRIAVHSVAVALRMLASPLVMRSSPQAMAAHGRIELMTAMIAKGRTRLFQPGPSTGFRITAVRTTSAAAPDAERTSTNPVGPMSATPSLMKRNETPQIRDSATNARYGSRGLLDTRRPLVGREHERHRSVVLDVHAHDCTKAAGLGLYSALAEPPHERLIELLGTSRIARPEQARPPAAAHVGEERELGHDEGRAFDVHQAQVHLPRLVREHAEVDDLVREPLHRAFVVVATCTHQQHKALADGCSAAALPAHAAGGGPLGYDPQRTLSVGLNPTLLWRPGLPRPRLWLLCRLTRSVEGFESIGTVYRKESSPVAKRPGDAISGPNLPAPGAQREPCGFPLISSRSWGRSGARRR